jgi:hypothetical protein
LRVFAPTSGNTSAFGQPTEGALHHPTPSGKTLFAWQRWLFFGLIPSAAMFDVFNVALLGHKLMDIFKVISFIRTQMLLALGTLDRQMNYQIVDRPFVVLIGTGDPDRQGSPR